MKVHFELTGRTALLMHQDSIDASTEVKAWQKDPKNKNISVAGDDRTPAWTWIGYTYNDGNHVTMPAGNIMVCLRQAGAKIILQKQKTYKEITQSGMLIDDEEHKGEHCKFTTHGHQIEWSRIAELRDCDFSEQCERTRNMFGQGVGFRLWAKRAVIGKAKHVRVRPRFDNWNVAGTIETWAPELTEAVMERLFTLAGNVGLGDWRPGCKTPGPYGMFTAKLRFEKD